MSKHRFSRSRLRTPHSMKPVPLTEGSIVRALVRLSIPVVLANILQSAYQITDTFWVGRLSTEAVAAVSLSFPISFLMIAIGSGLPIAGAVLIAQYKGRGDDRAMNHVAAQTLLMVLAVSVVTSGIGFVFSEPLMRFMGAQPNVLPDAVSFTQYTFLGFIFVFGFYVYQSLMRGLGVVQIPMYIVLVHGALEPRARSALHLRLGTNSRARRRRRRHGHAHDAGPRHHHRLHPHVRQQRRLPLASSRFPPRLAAPLEMLSPRRPSLGRAGRPRAELHADDAAGGQRSAPLPSPRSAPPCA